MATLIGLDSTLGLEAESTWGTAPTMGAGDKFQPAAPIAYDSGKKRNIDETSLGQSPTRTSKVQGQCIVPIPCLPCYQGQAMDIILLTLFDTLTQRTQDSTWRASYRREISFRSQPTSSYALVWTPDSTIWVGEIPGIRTDQVVLAAADGNECTMQADCLGLPPTIDGVNGATEVGNLTHSIAADIWDYMHFDHSKLWIAKRNETLAVMQMGKWSLTLGRALSRNNRATKSSGGVSHVSPKRVAKHNILLSIQPKEQENDFWGAAWDDESCRFKAVLELIGDRGAPGFSVSGADPTADISGSGSGTIGINIDGDGAQQVTIAPAGLTTRSLWAAYLQAQIRALTWNDYRHASAILGATVTVETTGGHDYVIIKAGDYQGDDSSVVVTAGTSGTDYSTVMELGVAAGGTEAAGESNRFMMFLPELLYVSPDPRSYNTLDRISPEIVLRASQMLTDVPSGFANGDQTYLTSDCTTPRAMICNMLAAGLLDP